MHNMSRQPALATSPAHDAFQFMFDTADVFSSFLQPSCKGIGRWQLEMAHLSTQQAQANMELGRRLMRCMSPFDFVSETMNYWQTLSKNVSQAGQNMAFTAVRSGPPYVAFANPFEVVPLPVKKARDTIRLPEFDEPELPFERQVA
jgi:hypothetical protein